MKNADVCCGFGGTFCVKYRDISNSIVSEKTDNIEKAEADLLLAGDLGCLMNMAGKLQRQGAKTEVRHVAEVLAGMTDTATHRRARHKPCRSPARHSRRMPSGALNDPQLQQALGTSRTTSSTSGGKAVDALPEFDALRDNARDIKNHVLAHLDLYLETYEQSVTRNGGQVHWAATARMRADAILDICRRSDAKTVTKGKSMISEEIGLNEFLEESGIRSDRDRSRRIHHPAARRAPEPHHRAGRSSRPRSRSRDEFRKHHTHLAAKTANSSEPESLLERGARGAARRIFRTPMSASPAPISWSPRPARRSSSPTRATAI